MQTVEVYDDMAMTFVTNLTRYHQQYERIKKDDLIS